jgi:hypothetical protein
MKTFADIKRKLVEGNSITMVRHDWYPDGKLIGLERKVIKKQSNAVQFEGGSWLRLDKKACDYIPSGENSFLVRLEGENFMEYRIN